MASIVAVARMLAARDPRRAAEVILEFLGNVNVARSTGLYVVEEEGRLRLLLAHGATQAALEWSGETYVLYPEVLHSGREVREGRDILIPVLELERLVGLLYFDAEHVDVEGARELMPLLAEAIAAAAMAPAMSDALTEYLAATPTAVIERQRLLVLLNRHEWNLARVARELRITRTTLYARMAAHKIERVRIPKGDGRRRRTLPEPA